MFKSGPSIPFLKQRPLARSIISRIGAPVSAAYSTRKIGLGSKCMRVVRSRDSSELDVGFSSVNGFMDSEVLLSFCRSFYGSAQLGFDSGNGASVGWTALNCTASIPSVGVQQMTVAGGTTGRIDYQLIPVSQGDTVSVTATVTRTSGVSDVNTSRIQVEALNSSGGWLAGPISISNNTSTPVTMTGTYTVPAGVAYIKVGMYANPATTAITMTASGLLISVCAAAYVKTWYDQSGAEKHMTQSNAANMPAVVSGGALNTLNGKPTLTPRGSSTGLSVVMPFAANGSLTLNAVLTSAPGAGASVGVLSGSYANDVGFGIGYNTGYNAFQYGFAPEVKMTTQAAELPAVQTGTRTTSAISMSLNGTPGTPTSAPNTAAITSNLSILPTGIGSPSARISEVIVMPSSMTTVQRNYLERNQGAAFGISVA
jgi:hypothetical protein